jgi:NADH-quinone oxidoreductase subunit L
MSAASWALAAVVVPYAAAAIALVMGFLKARWNVIAWSSALSIGVSAVASWSALVKGIHEPGHLALPWAPGIGAEFSLRVDLLSAIVGVVVATLSFLIALYSIEYIGEWGAPRYWFLYTFFVASMLLLVYADDLLTMFIGWEGTGLSSWGLISFYYDEREEAWVGDPGRKRLGVPMWFTPTHSGLRAISFTRVGDMGLLIGMGAVFAVLGSTSISVMLEHSSALLSTLKGLGVVTAWIVLLYMGALAKSAQMPFHEWLVTAMTGPTSVSALIHAATMVKAGVYFALRFTPAIALGAMAVKASLAGFGALAWLSLLTAFATATMAVVARELKLILAFSTASQLSYMLAAVFAAAYAGDPGVGTLGGLAHLASHAVFKAALFLAAGAVIHAVHSRFITDMGALRRLMPVTFASMLLAALSLSAIPPFSGWWSKDLAVQAINLMGSGASTVALVTAFLTAAYTARMVYYVFLGEARYHGHPHEPGKLMLYPYALLGVASLGLGLVWPYIEKLMEEAAAELVHGHLHVPHAMGVIVFGTLAGLTGFSTIALYIWGREPFKFVESSAALSALRDFLYDRWLLNPVIYRVIVYPGRTVSKMLLELERALDGLVHGGSEVLGAGGMLVSEAAEEVLDKIIHEDAVKGGAVLSKAARGAHRGDLRTYLTYFVVGIIIAMLLSLWVTM